MQIWNFFLFIRHVTEGITIFSFLLNIILYKRLNSRYLTDVLGSLYGNGNYKKVTTWLNDYAKNTSAILTSEEDVVIGTDNEQRLGKTYVASINSSLTTSVIAVIVAFVLKTRSFFQYIFGGRTSNWRFGEKAYGEDERENIVKKALSGRELGKSPESNESSSSPN